MSALHLENVTDGDILGRDALDDDLLTESWVVQDKFDGFRGGIGGTSPLASTSTEVLLAPDFDLAVASERKYSDILGFLIRAS